MKKKNKSFTKSKKISTSLILSLVVVLFATLGMTAAAYISGPILMGEGSEILPLFQKSGQFMLDKSGKVEPIKTKPSLLTGEEIDHEVGEKIIAVMVENHPSSRPMHSGIDSAELVYEALVEGGITRFMLVFSNNYPERVGPVRSARPYFVSWAKEYPAVYVHAGGSQAGLAKVYSSNLIDADEGTTGTFRDYDYAPPHNLFADLNELADSIDEDVWKEYKTAHFDFLAKDEEVVSGKKAEKISISFSRDPSYNIEFEYDKEKEIYLRKLANLKHIDTATDKQISTKNLVVIYTPYSVVDEIGRLDMTTVGSGSADFFIKGKQIEGIWKKESDDSAIQLEDKKGNKIKFAPGKIWIAVTCSKESVVID